MRYFSGEWVYGVAVSRIKVPVPVTVGRRSLTARRADPCERDYRMPGAEAHVGIRMQDARRGIHRSKVDTMISDTQA